tara:strand:- start:24512 stop:25789 length:1278 start_codon:yes stop_codon:yes gene_type:complete
MKKSDQSAVIDKFRCHFRDEEMILLESQMQEHPSSESSFLAVKPKNSIKAYGDSVEFDFDGQKELLNMNPWDALKKFRERCDQWLFGYFGYDLKNFTERIYSQNRSIIQVPDLYFFEPEWLFQFKDGDVTQWLGNTEPDIQFTSPDPEEILPISGTRMQPMITQDEYIQSVESIQQMIKDGDFYELNFSYPLRGRYTGRAYSLYSQMRKINPVPFGAYMKFDQTAVCSASPERFLKKSGKKIISQPIKGTSERSEDPRMDETRKQELQNEKNRAENLMIVDLVRHDLSKIALNGTVHVSRLYDIQTFGTVHQLISTIEAEVNEGVDTVDVIRSCFPMGSMTGAPKIEVMKVIDDLEDYKRGLYSGAIGYFTPQDDFDFNVVIRTAILQNGEVVFPVGGAITSDSDPLQEWSETEIKSRAITRVFL